MTEIVVELMDIGYCMDQMERLDKISSLKYTKRRATERLQVLTSLAMQMPMDEEAVRPGFEAIFNLADASAEDLQRHGDLDMETMAFHVLIEHVRGELRSTDNEKSHAELIARFRRDGLRGMYAAPKPATAPVSDACFVCCDASPDNDAECCPRAVEVCAKCYDQCEVCPFCRKEIE